MSNNNSIKIIFIAIVIFYLSSSQDYKRGFVVKLPSQSQILTLNTVVNTTPITIYSKNIKQTILQNQPYSNLKQIIDVNITYNQKYGFKSQWSDQKIQSQQIDLLIGKEPKIQQSIISCKLNSPKIIYNNKSSFTLGNHQIHYPRIVTTYEQILKEQTVLDVWKKTKKDNQQRGFDPFQQLILVMINDGTLVIAQPQKKQPNKTQKLEQTKYTVKKVKIYNQMIKEGYFNSQRYQLQNKIYFFSQQFQVQIKFENSKQDQDSNRETSTFDGGNEEITFNILKIQFQDNPSQIIDYKWITGMKQQGKQINPKLAILTKRELQFYQWNAQNKFYTPLKQLSINYSQITSMLNMDQQMRQRTKNLFTLQQIIYDNFTNVIYLIDRSIGIFYCPWNQNSKKFQPTQNLYNKFNCNNIVLSSQQYNSTGLTNIQFFMHCDNILFKLICPLTRNNKFKCEQIKYNQFTIPAGEIMISNSDLGNLIFSKGQLGVVVYRSWKYPKVLQQDNIKVSNFFVFGSEFVSVIEDNMVIFGQMSLVGQNIVCNYNQNYQKSSLKVKQNFSQGSASSSNGITLFIEYIAECDFQILSKSPYLLQVESKQYNKYEYCRYKKQYTNIKVQQNSTSNPTINSHLIIILVIAVLTLSIGLMFWIWQRKKIGKILEQEGLPVGSQQLQSQEVVDKYFKSN